MSFFLPYASRSHKTGRRQLFKDLDRQTELYGGIGKHRMHERAVGFQIPIGLSAEQDTVMVFRPISDRDMPPVNLLLGQMRGRVLSVATSRFADKVALALTEMSSA
jgi:hypothetical protein